MGFFNILHQEKLSPKQIHFLKASAFTLGIIKTTSQKTGISRSSHYNWMQSNQYYKESFIELLETSLDFAEMCLFEQMRNGDSSSTTFYLKTKGRYRGYF